ncbi:MAG: CPBP family intramembrane metalloprotease [Candidatus Eremiobacteraeota bacterium]|nr:CPBP family intramembrane metalloprotease [Candidatus Eremiobacteraeota bacterium]
MQSLQRNRRLATIVGLIFALGWPAIFPIVQHRQQDLGNVKQDFGIIVLEWTALIVLFGIVLFWERLNPLDSTGFVRPKHIDLAIVGGLVVLAAIVTAVLAHAHITMPRKGNMLAQALDVPVALRIALVVTAGICEEAFFRGYALERLRALTGNIWVGALIGTALFTAAHIPRYGLSVGLIGVAATGAVLSAIYVWRRNLLPCIALHCFLDGMSLLAIPAVVTFVGK